MSVMDELKNVVTTGRELLATVSGKVKEIDKQVDTALAAVPDQIRKTMSITIYVDAGGNDKNEGSATAPIKTMAEAARRIPAGARGIIRVARGQVFQVEPLEPHALSDRQIIIQAWSGLSSLGNDPILRMIPVALSGSDSAMFASFVRASSRVQIRFENIAIETGKLTQDDKDKGRTVYSTEGRPGNNDYGGFVSRGGGPQESAIFDVQFSRCKIKQQDFRLFTTKSGIYSVSFYQTEVEKEGDNDSIFDSTCPKSIDLRQASFLGFGPRSIEEILEAVPGNHIMRISSSSAR